MSGKSKFRLGGSTDDSADGEEQEESDDDDDDKEDGSDEEMNEDEKDEDVEMDEKPKAHDPNDLSAFKMDEYDDEESTGVGEFQQNPQLELSGLMIAMGAFANVKGLSFYRDNNEDPYITLKEVSPI